MAVALVASSTSGTTDAQDSSRTVPVPTGAAATHVAVITIEIWLDTSTDPTITWPSGFTQIAYVESTTDGFMRLYVARKVLTGADTGNYTMSWSGSYWNQAQCTLWSGVDNTTPLDVAVNTAVTAANTTMPAVSLTTVTAGCGMIHVVANENSATGTAPTGYTERQEANYLRTNTKVAGAAGAETPSGGSISVSTVKLGALIALRPASSGQTTNLSLATETDTARVISAAGTLTLGRPTETDTARVIIGAGTLALGRATETDSPFALGISAKTTPISRATETDGAQTLAVTRTVTLGVATETDSALGATIGQSQTSSFGATSETDTAHALSVTAKTFTLGVATETDAASALSQSQAITRALSAASETDASFGLAISAKTYVLGVATETDTAYGVSTGTEVTSTLSRATETDGAHSMAAAKNVFLGCATETETVYALSVTQARTWTLGQATETSTAHGLTGGPVTERRNITIVALTEPVANTVMTGSSPTTDWTTTSPASDWVTTGPSLNPWSTTEPSL